MKQKASFVGKNATIRDVKMLKTIPLPQNTAKYSILKA